MKVVTFKADEVTLTILERLAAEEGVSRSEVIRSALAFYAARGEDVKDSPDAEKLAAAAREACVEVLIGRPGTLKYVIRFALGGNGRYRAARELGYKPGMMANLVLGRFGSRAGLGPEAAAAAAAALELMKAGVIKPLMEPNPENLFAPVCTKCGRAFAYTGAAINHVRGAHTTELSACAEAVARRAVDIYAALAAVLKEVGEG